MNPVYDLYFRLLPVRKINTDNQLFSLNESEIKAIRKKEKTAVWLSAVIGALGVIILYALSYSFPHWFRDISFSF